LAKGFIGFWLCPSRELSLWGQHVTSKEPFGIVFVTVARLGNYHLEALRAEKHRAVAVCIGISASLKTLPTECTILLNVAFGRR
jgi:hypothetical protein